MDFHLTFTLSHFESFSRLTGEQHTEQLKGGIRVKCLAHRRFFTDPATFRLSG